MKNLKLLLLAIPFILFACSSDDDDVIIDNEGYLKQIISHRIDYKLGVLDEKTKVVISDKRLNPDEFVVYNDTTNIGWYGDTRSRYIERYKYDDNNNILELERIGKYADNSNIRYAYEYDDKGNKVKLNKYFDFGLAKTYKYFYKDGLKQPIKEEERDVITTSIGYDHLYTYSGNITTKESYKLDGSLFYKNIFYYDNYNNLLKHVGISPSGKEQIVEDISYKYDNSGRVLEKVWLKLNGSKRKNIYSYQDGKLSKIEFVDALTNEVKFIHTFDYIYS